MQCATGAHPLLCRRISCCHNIATLGKRAEIHAAAAAKYQGCLTAQSSTIQLILQRTKQLAMQLVYLQLLLHSARLQQLFSHAHHYLCRSSDVPQHPCCPTTVCQLVHVLRSLLLVVGAFSRSFCFVCCKQAELKSKLEVAMWGTISSSERKCSNRRQSNTLCDLHSIRAH
jgi:hypothetical protein